MTTFELFALGAAVGGCALLSIYNRGLYEPKRFAKDGKTAQPETAAALLATALQCCDRALTSEQTQLLTWNRGAVAIARAYLADALAEELKGFKEV